MVEKAGIARAKQAIEQADLLLMVYDAHQESDPLALAKALFGCLPASNDILMIANKVDLTPPSKPLPKALDEAVGYLPVYVSCKTGQGLEALITAICDKVGFHPPENSLIARTRHLDALRRTQAALQEADEQLHTYHAGELVAESLRQAQLSLNEITGEFTADDLLGKIFGSFCIGK